MSLLGLLRPGGHPDAHLLFQVLQHVGAEQLVLPRGPPVACVLGLGPIVGADRGRRRQDPLRPGRQLLGGRVLPGNSVTKSTLGHGDRASCLPQWEAASVTSSSTLAGGTPHLPRGRSQDSERMSMLDPPLFALVKLDRTWSPTADFTTMPTAN